MVIVHKQGAAERCRAVVVAFTNVCTEIEKRRDVGRIILKVDAMFSGLWFHLFLGGDSMPCFSSL